MSKLDEEMREQMNSVFEKHLPRQQSEWLQKRLNKVDTLEEELENLEEELDQVRKNRDEVLKDNTELKGRLEDIVEKEKTLEKKEVELTARENKIKKQEDDWEVKEMQMKLEASENRADELHGLVKTVFKSPVSRKMITENESRYYDDNYYNSQTGNYESRETGKSVDRTVEERTEVED